jgi:hypothetical protein
VRDQPDGHLPVHQLSHVIAQPLERLPALRAPVPAALEVPDHLNPGQMRIIPPPRPGARAPGPRRAAALLVPAAVTPARRTGPHLLRRPPEHHPLQHRQRGLHLLQLGVTPRGRLTQPGVLRPQLLVLRTQLSSELLPAPVRLQRPGQHIFNRGVSIHLRQHPSRSSHKA